MILRNEQRERCRHVVLLVGSRPYRADEPEERQLGQPWPCTCVSFGRAFGKGLVIDCAA